MSTAPLIAEISTKGAKKAASELKLVSSQAKKTENNVVGMGLSFKSIGKNASAAAAAISGPMGGISSRISSVVTVLTSGTAAATGFGLAIAGAGYLIAAGVKELDIMNVELAKTEAILRATGNASGKTALQLQEQARQIAFATLASTEGIQQAQAKLLTFDRIQGKVFDDAIMLAQDLATVMGGDASSQALALGKALQDPVKGITALNRVGVSFTAQQADQIKAMVASGNTMKAQTVIIAALKAQVGGAGADVAKDSLAGKLDTAGQLYTEFTAKLADNTGAYSLTGKLIDGMIGRFAELNEMLRSPTAAEYADQAMEVSWALAEQQNKLDGLNIGTREYIRTQNQVTALTKEKIGLIKLAGEAGAKENAESIKAANADLAASLKRQKDEADSKALLNKDAASADLDAFFALEDRKAERLKLSGEEQKRLQLEDLEFYTNMLKLKGDADQKASDESDMINKISSQAKLDALGDVTSNLGAILGEQSALFKAAAITETTINTYSGATAAYKSLAGIPIVGPALGAAAAGVVIAGGLANVRKIASAREQGGQLSAGQTSTIAERGEVEVITPANASRVRTASQMRGIMGGDSGGSTNVSLVVIDQSTGGKNFSSEQNDDGRIILLIRDTVSNDLQGGNTQISKSLASSFKVDKNNG